jgi:hypothetical protein
VRWNIHRRCSYNARVLKITCCVLLLAGAAVAQEKKAEAPQVKVNYLNVCAPSQEEQRNLTGALATIPAHPTFASDFEVARGRSTVQPGTAAAEGGGAPPAAPTASTWVRIRREFSTGTMSNVQYTFTKDATGMAETLVFRVRDPKRDQPLQISIQDAATSGTPASMLGANAPADRVRLERFGGASVVLARCPNADQKQYEAVFTKASSVMTEYRRALHVPDTVPADLARVK